ncbi:SRPBCC domain-containing protein [Brevibacillus ruminantium]|uniref:SRPBCC domain-containing protein n=1 Tax=Brevibacillus ruminantium TaxID=2950604 RepID=A0ABY4WUL3_9BACL|nr:SRPBCC domain-containing protein [Brevibacillus ruminantium]USG68276.1 SRPBCC domain-containing protein [Brevibacillus ruminantium]
MSTSAPEFTITRTLNARRELVWRAWTEEKELAAWLPSTPLESISFDVREGGHYRYTMVNSGTGEEYHTGGVFLDVVPFERLVFTWGHPNDPNSPVVTLTLAAHGDGDRTEMIFHLRGFAGHPGDKYMYDGWSGMLDNLTMHLREQKQ